MNELSQPYAERGLMANDGSGAHRLRVSEKRLAAILDTTVDAIITIDDRGSVLSFNSAAEKIFGYRADEVIGENVRVLMPERYAVEHDQYIRNYLQSREAKIIGIGREVVGRRRNGSEFPMDLSVSEVAIDGSTTFTGIIRDISERRRLQSEILRIGDDERRRIGQDLHDELGQMLTGLGLMAQNVARRLEQRGADEADDVRQIATFVRKADEFARNLSRGLVPVELGEQGLSAAIERLARNGAKLFGIDCTFSAPEDLAAMDPFVCGHLYRIAQEALSNATRHGKATRVAIDLSKRDSGVVLSVTDNGTGLPPDWEAGEGLGIKIMHYRASIAGGTLEVKPRPEGGTRVTCVIPDAASNRRSISD